MVSGLTKPCLVGYSTRTAEGVRLLESAAPDEIEKEMERERERERERESSSWLGFTERNGQTCGMGEYGNGC